MQADLPPDEAARIEELKQLKILDTAPESGYDDLVYLASQICGTPIALMSLIDTQRQFLKLRVGLSVPETARDVAFCAHAILKPDVMIVPDATADERFADNPLVRSDPNIRFYAGALLVTSRGHAMGTLCVIDRVPRTLSAAQEKACRALGRQVVALLELRLAKDEAERASEAKTVLLGRLTAEQEKSQRLLLSLFPKPIAERLQSESPKCVAEEYSAVSILFADIHDFWKIAGTRPPAQLVELLNQVFSLFDRLADTHCVQKIKTIGDSYMAVAGMPEPRPDHARCMADMALSMQREIVGLKSGARQPFSVRIGIHSGPVVAGVVGIKRWAYDLWGPTVNLANQMEACGVPGGIQVTADTHALLKDDYLLEPRGEFYVKGQGEVATYLLRGRRPR